MKQRAYDNWVESIKSLPSWERGLKQLSHANCLIYSWSLPSWERGLKLNVIFALYLIKYVAPLVGAWIETMMNTYISKNSYKSLPSWERGLKLFIYSLIIIIYYVAPLVGAWIETTEHGPFVWDEFSRSPRGSVD